jgi:hypothetical protein
MAPLAFINIGTEGSDEPQQRGLSTSAFTNQADKFPRINLDGDRTERANAAFGGLVRHLNIFNSKRASHSVHC